MRQWKFFWVLGLWAAVVPASGFADTVSYSLHVNEDGPGTFNLYAGVDNDSFGLVQYAVELLNFDTLTNVSPFAVYSASTGTPLGFSTFRSANNYPVVSASQDVTSPGHTPIFGFGQVGGDLEADFGLLLGQYIQPQYGAPLLIAVGTWGHSPLHPQVPSINQVDGIVYRTTDVSLPVFQYIRRPATFVTQTVCADFACVPPPPDPNPSPDPGPNPIPPRAGTIKYTLELGSNGPGTYRLYATASMDDNFGMASFGVKLVNVDTIQNVSPTASFAADAAGPVGFSIGRSSGTDDFVAGIQDYLSPFFAPVHGLGQHPGSLTDFGVLTGTVVQPDYGAPLLLATGTYSPAHGLPNFASGLSVSGALFVDMDGRVQRPLSILTEVRLVPVPEPTSVLLFVVSIIGAATSRRLTSRRIDNRARIVCRNRGRDGREFLS